MVALRPWVLRAGALRRPRAAFFRPPAPALFLGLGLDYRVGSCYTLKLQGGALLLSIEKCLGLWPGRFSFFSPPPPPPPSGGGAQEGTTRSAPLRSENGTPGFPRARNLHKTGILFNLRRLKKTREQSRRKLLAPSAFRLRPEKSHPPLKTTHFSGLGASPRRAQQNNSCCAISAH